MQFTPEHIQLIKEGAKTQTRRVTADFEVPQYKDNGWDIKSVSIMTVEGGLRLKWAVGNTYAICPGRGKASEGRIKIVSIRWERLQGISEKDALAEGCEGLYAPTLGYFNFRDHPYVTCSTMTNSRRHFSHVWDRINNRPNIRWEDDPRVWVLTFELVE